MFGQRVGCIWKLRSKRPRYVTRRAVDKVLPLVVCMRALDAHPPKADEQNFYSALGWIASLGASFFFGACFLPYGLPDLKAYSHQLKPLAITAMLSIGVSASNFALCLLLHLAKLLYTHPSRDAVLLGVAGGADVSLCALLGFMGTTMCGAAVTATVLSGTGIITSFWWAAREFQEPVSRPIMAGIGLLTLLSGGLVCSIANTELPQKLLQCWTADARKPDKVCGSPSIARYQGRLVATGVLLAFVAGLIDGTLMLPFKMYEYHSGDGFPEAMKKDPIGSMTVSALHQANKVVGKMEAGVEEVANETAFAINVSIGQAVGTMEAGVEEIANATASAINVSTGHTPGGMMRAVVKAANATFQDAINITNSNLERGATHLVRKAAKAVGIHVKRWPLKMEADDAYEYLQGMAYGHALVALLLSALLFACDSQEFYTAVKACGRAGLSNGFFWSAGNFCSIHASQYLGVGLGFPLTQTSCGVASVLAITVLGEMPHGAQRMFCLTAVVLLVLGASILTAAH
eukprot:TRINITY_DN26444_c0_g1_i2.p1 TRINITY_DN26444_c0_g1~~TRINITY_DN26444_c0_g1_i2.p1  ORF type:complete len:518 (-),score=58.04 TRINITY_DN26444_c0_g1_i2:62-1615(-)